jgi:hypothetical protein
MVALRFLTNSACSGSSSQVLVVLLLVAVAHLAEQELSFELIAGQFLNELYQVGFGLHEGFKAGVDFRVESELANQFFFTLWRCYCHRTVDLGAQCSGRTGPAARWFNGW